MKVKYDNKSILNVYDLAKYDKDSLHGKRIIGIMANKFIDVSYVFKYQSNEETVYFTLFFSKEKYDALNYIYTSVKNNKPIDKNHEIHSKIPEFVKALEEDTIDAFFEDRFSFKTLNYYEYILPVDELKFTFDHADIEQNQNDLNMLTYNKSCDYYTSSFALYLDSQGKFDILKLFKYESNGEWYNTDINWKPIDNNDIKYINFLYNVEFMYNGEKVT